MPIDSSPAPGPMPRSPRSTLKNAKPRLASMSRANAIVAIETILRNRLVTRIRKYL